MDVNAREILTANIRREMQIRHWTQQTLADRAGVSQPRIAEILAGSSDCRISTVERISAAFGLPVSSLLLHPTMENVPVGS